MVLSRAIPAALHAEVQRLRSEQNPATGVTWTSRDVAAHLLAAHGVKCSHMTVIRLEAALSERGDALIVQALRDEMRDEVGPMKARLVKASKRLAEAVAGEEDTSKIAAGVRALSAVVDSFAKLGGVAAPMALDVTSGGQRMAFYVPAKLNDSTGTAADVAPE
jgi:hypothetical protein